MKITKEEYLMEVLMKYDNNTCLDVYSRFGMHLITFRYDSAISRFMVLWFKVLAY